MECFLLAWEKSDESKLRVQTKGRGASLASRVFNPSCSLLLKWLKQSRLGKLGHTPLGFWLCCGLASPGWQGGREEEEKGNEVKKRGRHRYMWIEPSEVEAVDED